MKSDGLEDFAPEVDYPIDPGILEAVLILRRSGVETFESCQGGDGHPFFEPTIRFYGDAWTGYKAFAIAMENGLAVSCLNRSYQVVNGELEGPIWEIVFCPTLRGLRQPNP